MQKRTAYRIALAVTGASLIAGIGTLSVAHDQGGHGAQKAGHSRGGPGHGMGRGGPMRAMLEYLDTNTDGAIEKGEAEAVIDSKLTQFDANADRSIELAEFEGLWLDFSRRQMVDRFQALDDDGDGKVTEAEFARVLDRAFARADANEDGRIDRSDRRGRRERPEAQEN